MDYRENSLDTFITKNFPKKNPQGIKRGNDTFRLIYHYTSVEVFEKMLHDDADFYVSESSLLNDSKEFYTGLDYLFDYQKGKDVNLFHGLTKEDVMEWISNPSEEPWIMCFSVERDSLGQWIAYTDRQNGGVAIGFSIERLSERIRKSQETRFGIDPRYGCPMFLVPCFYEKSDYECIQRLIGFMFGEYRAKVLGTSADDMTIRSITMELMLIFSSMIKHESFHGEKEWRLVFFPHSEKRVKEYEYVGGKPRLRCKMFNKENLLRNSMVDIVLSPHGTGTRSVSSLLKLRGRNDLTPICSASPYNGM